VVVALGPEPTTPAAVRQPETSRLFVVVAVKNFTLTYGG
jgi:hypothetical protein